MKNQSFSFFLSLALICSWASFGCQGEVASENSADLGETQKAQPVNSAPLLQASKLAPLPLIDGMGEDTCWQQLSWHPIDQLWLGAKYTPEDFTGRYKIGWGEDFVYLLVEITDDQLVDTHPDGLNFYWDDDCVEVFIDENHSGGNHQYNHNAFAYHIATDYQVVDIGPDSLPHYYNDHITAKRSQNGQRYTWEIAMAVYDDRYVDGQKNSPQKLAAHKKMGFAIAYCDNDQSKERENFIGSVFVPGSDKNRGWIDAGIFGTLVLVD